MFQLFIALSLILQLSFGQVVDKSTCTGPTANIVTCNEPIKEFICDQNDAPICNGTMIVITDPLKDFFIKAEDDNIAIGTTFDVVFSQNNLPLVEGIEGILAGGDESLLGSTVMITNEQNVTLTIKKLELNGDWSGDGFRLILKDGANSGGIRLNEIKCGDNGLACTLKSSAMGETPEGATSNCVVEIIDENDASQEFLCLDLYMNQESVQTAGVPSTPSPVNPARITLEEEIERELHTHDGNDGDAEEVTVNIGFSKDTIIQMWSMVGVIIICNALLAWRFCWYKSKNVTVDETEIQI